MIIVTGMPRSRTSLMMQILEALGVPYVGSKYVNKEENYEYNKNGLYEKPQESILGTRNDYGNNTAMKIILFGLFPNKTNNYKGTPKQILKDSEIILCLRKPINIFRSVQKLKQIKIQTPQYMLYDYGSFLMWLSTNLDIANNISIVETDSLIMEPNEMIMSIVQALKLSPGQLAFDRAVDCIKPDLTITDSPQWPFEFRELGGLLDAMYEAMVVGDMVKAWALVKDNNILMKDM